jgi:hypothetical protein
MTCYVNKIEVCMECDGAGIRRSPANGGSATVSSRCDNCSGSGRMHYLVPLSEAIRDMAFEPSGAFEGLFQELLLEVDKRMERAT